MNTDVLEGKWKQVKGQIKEFFGKLTDDDIVMIAGSKDKLLGKLQERYGYTREQAHAEYDKFRQRYGDFLDDLKAGAEATAAKVKDTFSGAKESTKSRG
jgi:uncharacterized protein YjbJ (UPF0337 family)